MSEPTPCKNCGAILQGDYCIMCGQAAKPSRRPVIGLAQDVLIDTLALDGKLLRSLRLLFLWPGQLARAFLDGKRASHTAPFRLYLFTSLFFFLFAFMLIENTLDIENNDATPNAEEVVDLLEDENIIAPAPPGAPDSSTDDNTDDGSDGRLTDEMELNGEPAPDWMIGIGNRMEDAWDRLQEDPRLFLAQVQENIPRVMLLAPAIYALILAIFYIYRRRFLAYDHLVVSLYMHAALYAYLILGIAISLLPSVGWLSAFVFIWAGLQPYAVLRQAYGSNWFSVIIKGFVTNTLYLASLVIIIFFGLGYSLYLS